MKEVQDGNRKLSLGGSDAAAVLGLNDYSSPFDVWVSKISTEPDEEINNAAIYWGHAKEPVIADFYAKRHNVVLLNSPKRCSKYEWMTGSPDRLIEYNGEEKTGYYDDPISGKRLLRRGLEIKTANHKQFLKWGMCGNVGMGSNPAPVITTFEQAKQNVPLSYYVQCSWYMYVMGFKEWDLCVLINSSDYREYRLILDEEFAEWAVGKCKHFWQEYVEKKREPPVDHGSRVNKYLCSKYLEKQEGIIKKATKEEEEKVKELKRLDFEMKELSSKVNGNKIERDDLINRIHELEKRLYMVKEHKDALSAYFKDKIGQDRGIEFPDGTVLTWTSTDKQSRTLRKKWR